MAKFVSLVRDLHDTFRDHEADYDPLRAHEAIADLLLLWRLCRKERIELPIAGGPIRDLMEWYDHTHRDLTRRILGAPDGGTPSRLSGTTLALAFDRLRPLGSDDPNDDLLGRAYEEVLGDEFRGVLGQYFTPRPIVEYMVEQANPCPGERVIDPAAGSGGFLLRCLSRLRGTGQMVGIDRSRSLVNLANATLALEGGPPRWGSVVRGDSLRGSKDGVPAESPASVSVVVPLAHFDLLLSNPPFGQRASEETAREVLDQRLGRGVVYREVEALFLMRAVDLLRSGGRLGIVLPIHLLWGPKFEALQQWLLRACAITSVVRLPKEAFAATGSTIKCALLFARKGTRLRAGQGVLVAFPPHVGLGARGEAAPLNDLPRISRTAEGVDTSVIAGMLPSMPDQVPNPLRRSLDFARVSVQRALDECARAQGALVVVLGEVVAEVREGSRRESAGTSGCLIEADDVGRELGRVLSAKSRRERLSGAKLAQPGDIIFLRIRPYLRKVAIVPRTIVVGDEGEVDLTQRQVWVSGEFFVLRRVASLWASTTAEYLWAFLRSDLLQWQVLPEAVGGTRPRVGIGELLKSRIAIPPPERQSAVVEDLRAFEVAYREWQEGKRSLVSRFKRLQEIPSLTGGLVSALSSDLGAILEKADLRPKSHSEEFY